MAVAANTGQRKRRATTRNLRYVWNRNPPYGFLSALSAFGLNMRYPSRGVNVIAATQLSAREINITQNRELQYSPVRSSDSPMAANATTAMAVAPNSGHWFCEITSRITG